MVWHADVVPVAESLNHVSLMHGAIPLVLQMVGMVVLGVAIGGRARRRTLSALAVGCAGLTVAGAYWCIASAGICGEPPPFRLWVWIGAVGGAVAVVVAGWRDSRWWQRVLSALAVPVSAACVASTVNSWVGYVPTVGSAWSELTGGPLPDQTDVVTAAAMQRAGNVPARGSVVSVWIRPDVSNFKHRDELVYLPPVWFASNPAPPLPTVMMIGGEFNTPSDWIRAGDAITVVDSFAAAHHGNAPVLVFVDSGGGFKTDTECVDGSRGNAGTHLTGDVVPFMTSHFGVSTLPASWGIVGFSAGGTCAVDLTVMHSDVFGSFVDIAGDIGPNSGTKAQTVDRLFGGSIEAWKGFDPVTVMARHGNYHGVSGVFIISGGAFDARGQVVGANNDEGNAARTLCSAATANGIQCSIEVRAGQHDWPFAGRAFAAALPWMAARIGIPQADVSPGPPLPAAASAAIQASPRSGGR